MFKAEAEEFLPLGGRHQEGALRAGRDGQSEVNDLLGCGSSWVFINK